MMSTLSHCCFIGLDIAVKTVVVSFLCMVVCSLLSRLFNNPKSCVTNNLVVSLIILVSGVKVRKNLFTAQEHL